MKNDELKAIKEAAKEIVVYEMRGINDKAQDEAHDRMLSILDTDEKCIVFQKYCEVFYQYKLNNIDKQQAQERTKEIEDNAKAG
jgi:hypothetical protein